MGRLNLRERNRGTRKRKSIVVIGSEGKNRTENLYLRNFSSRECIIKFSTGNSTDPIGMLNDLKRFIESEDISTEYGDKVYLLIDFDVNQNKEKQIKEVQSECEKVGIELIISNPTFELWYILHFGYTTKMYQSSKQAKDETKKLIPGYTESMDVFLILKSKMQYAILNAKKLEKYHIENGQAFACENCSPYTNVYELIEELNKRNSRQNE